MLRRNLFQLTRISPCSYSTATISAENKIDKMDFSKWRIEVALSIYRSPVIAPPMTDAQRQFKELSELASHRSSFKCDFELQLEKDAKLLEKRKQLEAEGKDLSALDEEIGISSIQLKNEWKEKEEEFHRNYLVKEVKDEEAENNKSLRRKPDRKLVMLVKQRFSDAPNDDYVSPWILPRFVNSNGATLRQTTEQCIHQLFPQLDELSIGLKVLGNGPMSHFLHKYSKSMRNRLGFDGSILFFYPVMLYQKSTTPLLTVDFVSENVVDYKWCTREEVNSLIDNRKYRSAFSYALFE